jgi:hypothetical protein
MEPAPPLSPLVQPSSATESLRPKFLDPEPPSEDQPPLTDERGESRPRRGAPLIGETSPWAVAGLIVALLVVIAAVLLIVGVL